jgi:hypothetical protein
MNQNPPPVAASAQIEDAEPFYKKKIVIGGALAVILLGLLASLMKRPKEF